MLQPNELDTSRPESVLTSHTSSFRNKISDMEVLVIRLEGHASRLAGILTPPEEAQPVSSSGAAFSDDLILLINQFNSLNLRVSEIVNRLDEYI